MLGRCKLGWLSDEPGALSSGFSPGFSPSFPPGFRSPGTSGDIFLNFSNSFLKSS